jgi:hypothetical protein
MMLKVIPPDSYRFDEQTVQLIKVANSGLRGSDLKALIKRAGFNFADALRRADLKSGDVPVHVIALGATEFYGPNRNGDGFKEATCRKYHSTFVKYARWYRNHQNKDPEKSYGFIKYSEFNDEMKRIELLVILNGTKEAAARNGGFVADDEIKALHEGRDIPVSMACKVAYDVCAGCGNRAKTRKEYCTGIDEGGMCKRGGVKNRMTFVHDDGFINHVDNPDPFYFDISKVFRGADRIAYTTGMLKSASGLLLGGAELAEKMGLELPPQLVDGATLWPTKLQKLVIKLAQLEQQCENGKPWKYDLAFAPELQNETQWLVKDANQHQILSALMLNKIAIPFDGFVQLTQGKEVQASADFAKRYLPGVYGRMLADNSLSDINLKPYVPIGVVPNSLMKWAHDLADDYSLDQRYIEKRMQRAALYGVAAPAVRQSPLVKVASSSVEALTRSYALCKLAFLQAISDQDPNFDLTMSMVVRQNYLQ